MLPVNSSFINDALLGGNQLPTFPIVNNWRRQLLPHIEKAHHDVKWAQNSQFNTRKWWNEYLIQLRMLMQFLVDNLMADTVPNL